MSDQKTSQTKSLLMRAGLALAATAGVVALFASVADAVIPLPGRTLSAIAGVNRSAGRAKALQLDMKMRIGTDPPIASAELVSHPSGLARLEIRGYEGRVDRYLLSGEELAATMNGQELFSPRPLLQPFFLLQPSSETTLRAALESFGIGTSSIGLMPCGDSDCYVIGDPSLVATYEPPVEFDENGDPLPASYYDASDLDSVDSAPDSFDMPMGAMLDEPNLPRLWVDTQSLQIHRIDRANGVYVLFGPISSHKRIKVPSWLEIHEPDQAFPVRFEIERAIEVNAPPNAFKRSWLNPTDG